MALTGGLCVFAGEKKEFHAKTAKKTIHAKTAKKTITVP
jgi:hypothetical protein